MQQYFNRTGPALPKQEDLFNNRSGDVFSDVESIDLSFDKVKPLHQLPERCIDT